MDEEILELMRDYDLDKKTAERVQEIIDEYGVDPEDAIEIEESL